VDCSVSAEQLTDLYCKKYKSHASLALIILAGYSQSSKFS
jgi:hypothetical protein